MSQAGMELLQRSAAKTQREATTTSMQDNTSAKGMEMDDTSDLETETEGHASHDMQQLYKQVATSVEGMLENLTPLSSECCIYRVPKKLFKVKKEAYKPRLLSIGPLHHGKKHLVAMEDHKLRYLQNFRSRFHKTLEEYVEIISKLERKIRDSYSESIKLSSEDFLKMILVDGCFIIEVILGYCYPGLRKPNDWIYNKPWLIIDVRRDMTLLENQLPFFLLQSLYNLAFPGRENDVSSFLSLSIVFFEGCLQMREIKSPQEMNEFAREISNTCEVKHFVDLLRACQLSSSLRSSRGRSKQINITIPTATELHEAGVRFQLSSIDKPLLDVDYRNGVLKIPKLKLADKCESLFRNLIAFEMCHYRQETYIADYIHLMDQLINTTKDVDILVKKRIIDNWLGDKVAVTNLFNNLLTNATGGSDFYFAGIYDNLNKYCESPWNEWKATLRHDYFSSPWRGASTIAAVILLLLTLIQTIFSAMSVK